MICTLHLYSDAAEFIGSHYEQISAGNKTDAIGDFIELLKKNPSALSLPLVDRRLVELVFNEHYKVENIISSNSNRKGHSVDDHFVIISAFDCPKFRFDHEKSRFHRLPYRPDPFPYDAAEAKISLYMNRYWILMERLRRSEVFAQNLKANNSNSMSSRAMVADEESKNLSKSKKFMLTTIECLLGSAVDAQKRQREDELCVTVVFGLLTRMKDGNWYLEDPTGFVKLDLSQSSFQSGLLGEHCYVIAEGTYDDGDAIFRVKGVGLPPSESAVSSRINGPYGDMNMFGGQQHSTAVGCNKTLAEKAKGHQNDMAVILSDIWLDIPAVIEKLRLLFNGFIDSPPYAFVFFGNFLSTHYGERQSQVFRAKFAEFYAMLSISFKPILNTSRLIFVPGNEDPGLADTLPRFPLLKCLLPQQLVNNPLVTFTSNPCRLTWFNREIVLFRSDLVQKLARHTVNCVTITDEMPLSAHVCFLLS